MKMRSILFALLLAFFASFAFAAPSTCPQFYLGGQAPDILSAKYSQKTQEIPFSAFGVIHSGITRTPLVSAEHLIGSEQQSKPPSSVKRNFYAEPRLPAADRAEPKDYNKSGYDQGHMSPFADMPDDNSRKESCSLANIIPQNPEDNEILWRKIEDLTRHLSIAWGELYVVTGPIFADSNPKKINDRVTVPNYIFKAIYSPKYKTVAAYFVANTKGGRYAVLPIAAVEKVSGLSIFPGLEDKVKQTAMTLPKPTSTPKLEIIEDKTIVPNLPAP
ncbi:MAG: DNA/RNA non-specific endonuclease [Desulfobaccales bacterium]